MAPTQGDPVLYIRTKYLKRIALFVQKLLGGPKFRPAADPLPGGAGPPKFNQLETSLPSPTDPVW